MKSNFVRISSRHDFVIVSGQGMKGHFFVKNWKFLVREIAVGTLKKFSFTDSGQGKGLQKIASPYRVKNQQKKYFTYLG
jgi:hypothetical protein